MKIHYDPIDVTIGDDGLPTSYRWRGRDWNVMSITDRWVTQAGWWRPDGTEKRDYVLVEAQGMDGAPYRVGAQWEDEGSCGPPQGKDSRIGISGCSLSKNL
jgi:hypothetical protein